MILDEIVAHKREEVAAQKARVPRAELEERIAAVEGPRGFNQALKQPGIALIAEIKRKSPSKGPILPGVAAVELAALYEQAGARALSILTDHRYFGGALQDLVSVRQSVKLPCLRKEFMIDPYQVYEARAAGADAILLIVRILEDALLRDLSQLAAELDLDVLVETHCAAELDRALAAGAHIIGINNRDLDTLTMDVKTSLELKHRVPGGKTLVSESGIYTRDQVKALEDGGVDAMLIGESLLTSKNIRGKIEELLGRGEG